MFIRLLCELNISIHHLFEKWYRGWIKLCNISAYLEQKCVSKLESPFNQLPVLVFLGNQFSVTWIRGKIDRKCYQFLAHYRLRAVNDQLINQRAATTDGRNRKMGWRATQHFISMHGETFQTTKNLPHRANTKPVPRQR